MVSVSGGSIRIVSRIQRTSDQRVDGERSHWRNGGVSLSTNSISKHTAPRYRVPDWDIHAQVVETIPGAYRLFVSARAGDFVPAGHVNRSPNAAAQTSGLPPKVVVCRKGCRTETESLRLFSRVVAKWHHAPGLFARHRISGAAHFQLLARAAYLRAALWGFVLCRNHPAPERSSQEHTYPHPGHHLRGGGSHAATE